MNKIQINRDYVESRLLTYVNELFELPEIGGVKLRDIVIQNNEHKEANLKEAISKSYHDCYSDSDISIIVNLPTNSAVSPADYMRHPRRLGITPDRYLGFSANPEASMYRMVFRDGIRYDFGFEFQYDDEYTPVELNAEPERYSNPAWPMNKVDEFWFVMVQALGKLYRKDYLISAHLANINVNETLVQQMILRDMKYGTNHHRYGYCEELCYRKFESENPFLTGDETFDIIASKLYAAARAYDELAKKFYPEYEPRSEVLFDIWRGYHENSRV